MAEHDGLAQCQARQVEPVTWGADDLDLFRQWFNSVQDTNGGYLNAADFALARRLYEALGMRVPGSIPSISDPASQA